MELTIKVKKKVDAKTLLIDAGVLYWEDATVNGIEDVNGDLIPCRFGERWKPEIDIDSGVIINWKKGVVANVHYKVCDDGFYYVFDSENNVILKKEGYVPDILDVERDSYGDYLIFNIDENGKISNWSPKSDFNGFKVKYKN